MSGQLRIPLPQGVNPEWSGESNRMSVTGLVGTREGFAGLHAHCKDVLNAPGPPVRRGDIVGVSDGHDVIERIGHVVEVDSTDCTFRIDTCHTYYNWNHANITITHYRRVQQGDKTP